MHIKINTIENANKVCWLVALQTFYKVIRFADISRARCENIYKIYMFIYSFVFRFSLGGDARGVCVCRSTDRHSTSICRILARLPFQSFASEISMREIIDFSQRIWLCLLRIEINYTLCNYKMIRRRHRQRQHDTKRWPFNVVFCMHLRITYK